MLLRLVVWEKDAQGSRIHYLDEVPIGYRKDGTLNAEVSAMIRCGEEHKRAGRPVQMQMHEG